MAAAEDRSAGWTTSHVSGQPDMTKTPESSMACRRPIAAAHDAQARIGNKIGPIASVLTVGGSVRIPDTRAGAERVLPRG